MVFRLTGDDTQIYLTKDTRGRRPVRRTGGHGRLDAAQGEVPTLHGAFHAQRALQGPADPQGMASAALKAVFAMESRESALDKAEQVAAEMRSRRLRAAANCLREGVGETTTYLLDEFPDAPQAHPHEQHDRAVEQGDPPAHARRGRLPRREQRAHARLRAHPVRHRERMVDPPLPRHVPVR